MTGVPFAFHQHPFAGGRTIKTDLLSREEPVSWGEALRLWSVSDAFVDAFVTSLAESPFDAFLWETPPVSRDTLTRPFEWVVVDSLSLAHAEADDLPFAEHLRGHRGIRVFDNLGGDAELIVPCAEGEPSAYPHLAAFVRHAPREQVRALWPAVAQAVKRRLQESPALLWVSTSGLGVYWTHVRLDERPKYYSHAPYARG